MIKEYSFYHFDHFDRDLKYFLSFLLRPIDRVCTRTGGDAAICDLGDPCRNPFWNRVLVPVFFGFLLQM